MTIFLQDVFLGIGSNVGDRVRFLADAVRRLRAIPGTRVLALSNVYETEPVGIKEQDSFLNAAVRLQTGELPREFHGRMKAIEKETGRQERRRWGPREIDIDILLFGDLVVVEPGLTIPHPELMNRRFVLQPLAEIASAVVHPTAGKSIGELLVVCGDTCAVVLSEMMTEKFITTLKE